MNSSYCLKMTAFIGRRVDIVCVIFLMLYFISNLYLVISLFIYIFFSDFDSPVNSIKLTDFMVLYKSYS